MVEERKVSVGQGKDSVMASSNIVNFKKQSTEEETMRSVKLKLPWHHKQLGVPYKKDGVWYADVVINPFWPMVFAIKRFFNKKYRILHYELIKDPHKAKAGK